MRTTFLLTRLTESRIESWSHTHTQLAYILEILFMHLNLICIHHDLVYLPGMLGRMHYALFRLYVSSIKYMLLGDSV